MEKMNDFQFIALMVSETLRDQNTLDRMSLNIRWSKDLRQTLFWRSAAFYLVLLTFYYGTAATTTNLNIRELLWVFPPVMFAGSIALILQDVLNFLNIRKAIRKFKELEAKTGTLIDSVDLLQSSFLGDVRFVWVYIAMAVISASMLIHDYGITWLKFL
jgi:hypothetical protein